MRDIQKLWCSIGNQTLGIDTSRRFLDTSVLGLPVRLGEVPCSFHIRLGCRLSEKALSVFLPLAGREACSIGLFRQSSVNSHTSFFQL